MFAKNQEFVSSRKSKGVRTLTLWVRCYIEIGDFIHKVISNQFGKCGTAVVSSIKFLIVCFCVLKLKKMYFLILCMDVCCRLCSEKG